MIWADPVPALSDEEELEVIDSIAKKVISMGLGIPFIVFLEGLGPMSKVGAEIPLLFASPFLESLGIPAYKYVALFSKRENAERVITKIEELLLNKKSGNTESGKGGTLIDKLKKFFLGARARTFDEKCLQEMF